jgi:hypothetical protein
LLSPLIDEAARVHAVTGGQTSAAGLDVLRIEPHDPKSPLFRFPQVLVTPHIAGFTDLMMAGTVNYIGQVIEEFAAGNKSRSILNSPEKPPASAAGINGKLCGLWIVHAEPVITPPAKHAANRPQRNHHQQTVDRSQLGRFELH